MTWSEDLRERVVGFVRCGGSKAEAARRFNVGRTTVYRWLGLASLVVRRKRTVAPYKLDPERLKAHVEAYPDAYQYERAEALGVSRRVVGYGLKRLNIKKNASVPRKRRQASQ